MTESEKEAAKIETAVVGSESKGFEEENLVTVTRCESEAVQGELIAAEQETIRAYSPMTSPLILSPGSAFSASSSEESASPVREGAKPLVPSRRSTGHFLGQGGNGRVFVRGGEAVKVMQADSWEGKLGALLEFHCAQQAVQGSSNLVNARALNFTNGTAEMTMELCSGDVWDLINMIDYDTAPAQALEQLAKAFLLQSATGLSAMHDAGYMHCDIKPGNVLLGGGVSLQQLASTVQCGGVVAVPAGTFKLSDFGPAMSVEEAHGLEGPTGTCGFNAPEMEYLNPESRLNMDALPLPDQKADIFSLGCALWEVLTGTRYMETSAEDWDKLLAPFSVDMKTALAMMTAYYPHQRPSARQIMEHPTLFKAPVSQKRKARLLKSASASGLVTGVVSCMNYV